MQTYQEREAHGFVIDVETLVNRWLERKSFQFEAFKRTWKSMAFSWVHRGSSVNLTEEHYLQALYQCVMIRCILPEADGNQRDLHVRVGGIFALYCLYQTQSFSPPILINQTIGTWLQMQGLLAQVVDAKLADAYYVFKSMREMGCFNFTCLSRPNPNVKLQPLPPAVPNLTANELVVYNVDTLGDVVDLEALDFVASRYNAAKPLASFSAPSMNVANPQLVQDIQMDVERIEGARSYVGLQLAGVI